MRLELGTFPVTDVVFSDRTHWSEGKLEIDKKGILEAIRRDDRITAADLEIVKPGESVRITSVRDVIEPRIKVSGPGVVYPGIVGRPVAPVGQGRTHRLSGTSVIEVAEVEMYHGNDAWLDGFIDMRAQDSDGYTSYQNVCVVTDVDRSLHIENQNEACHQAALLVSDALAAATRNLKPSELETFELQDVDPDLPRAVYICCHRSPQHYANSLNAFWTSIYGLSRQTPPWVLHPNELLDGAISVRTSWALVNNPVVQQMYSRHGKDFNFAGVIAIRTRWSAQNEKDITSFQAAKTAHMLGAAGAMITWDAGGNDFMEVIRTVEACENWGIATVFITAEEPPETEGPPLLEPLPEARAIVSLGVGRSGSRRETLPPPDKLIGQKMIMADSSQRQNLVPADGPLPSSGGGGHPYASYMSCFQH